MVSLIAIIGVVEEQPDFSARFSRKSNLHFSTQLLHLYF